MTTSKLVPAIAGLLAMALTGCGSDNTDNGGTGGGGGSGGSTSCNTDTTRLASHAAVSLRTDVMPIFSVSCVASACHDMDRPMAGMFLGNKITSTMPLVDADATAVHDNLWNVASQTAPAVMRVAANDPDHSFLLQKTADTHTTQGYTCTPQDPGVTNPCGEEMPPGATLCTQHSGQERWDTLAAWILQGAPDN